MFRSPKVLAPEEPRVRTREDPFFNGLLRGRSSARTKGRSIMDQSQMNPGTRNITRSVSDIGEVRRENMVSDTSEKPMELPGDETVASDIAIQPLGKSTLGLLSKIRQTASFPFPDSQIDSTFGPVDELDMTKQSSPRHFAAAEHYSIVTCSPGLTRPASEKSYTVSKCKADLSRISLPPSAATFFNGFSPQVEIVESCESIKKLNLFLNERRDDVNAGVPGKFLHAVIGQDSPDIGSIASSIMYAFYLNETLDSDQLCTVPVLNMKRADLSSHAELKWLLESCQIDESSLVFVDEIDLLYYDLFGSLRLVLLNGDQLPTRQQALKEAVVEVFNCTKDESIYPCVETITVKQDSSCCTIIAEKFAQTRPELLAGRGFSRLLLSGILVDTGNLSSPLSTIKDNYMAALLINGAGRFGSDGLYQILRHKMYDVSNLKMVDILRKDFKKWTRAGKPDGTGLRSISSSFGMSSIGLSVDQLLAHGDAATEDIRYFLRLEKLRLLVIMSGFHDSENNFKRELLVSAETVEFAKSALYFLESNTSQLPSTLLHKPGLREDMMAFEIDKLASRRTIERLLEEFGGVSKW